MNAVHVKLGFKWKLQHVPVICATGDAGEDEVAWEGASPGGRSLERLKAPSVIKQSLRSVT